MRGVAVCDDCGRMGKYGLMSRMRSPECADEEDEKTVMISGSPGEGGLLLLVLGASLSVSVSLADDRAGVEVGDGVRK